MEMNWLDIVLVCLAAIGLMKGLFDGVIKQVASLIALVIAIFLCGKVAARLKGYILSLEWFPEQGVTILSYILGFLLIVGIVLLAGEIVHKVIDVTPLSVLNHMAGGIAGLLLMIIFISLLLNLIEIVDRGSTLIPLESKVESRFYDPVKRIIPTIYPSGLFSTEE
ncbi:MAG: CvpA family protein [Tannerellaceae bacterium]|jgi:membrane protein required for colicin V production|nr:CvpA family protein [Tannerellaceae bacterium]